MEDNLRIIKSNPQRLYTYLVTEIDYIATQNFDWKFTKFNWLIMYLF